MLTPTRILILEAEEVFGDNLRAYLAKRCAEVRVATSGETALDCARDFRPDLVVLDHGLLGMDAIRTHARLNGQHGRCGFVLMTSCASEAVLQAARAAGIRHVLEKPFPFSRLETVLATELIMAANGPGERRRESRPRRGVDRCSGHGPTSGPRPLAAVSQPSHERRHADRRGAPDRYLAGSFSAAA